MRITDIRTVCWRQPAVPIHAQRFAGTQDIVLVLIETEDGRVGHGTARAHGGQSGEGIAEAVVRSLKPLLLNQDAQRREHLWQRMTALEPAGYVPVFAISAVDVALWDLAAQAAGLPLHRLLGGRHARLRAYASSAHLPDIDAYVAEAAACVARGYTAYKIHPFGDPARDIELCRALREAVGPQVALMLDPAKQYDRAGALRVGRALEALDFAWYEEPIAQHDIVGHAELRQALDVPLAGAETVPGHVHAAAQFLRADALDLVLCDVYWKAGVTGMLKTATLAEALGVRVASHHGASPLMNLANLHVLCGATNAEMIEILVPETGYDFGMRSYLAPDAQGFVTPPEAPGLGIALDWDFIERHTVFRR
jgi:L-alanine-DL-glutamate epimerase-like enolase superfamily enzyme